MADDWIKVRAALPSDGRLKIASRSCHVSSETVFGALVTLWCLADAHAAPDGTLTGYTKADIDALVGVPGFCDCLPADWIDLSGEFVKLPEYQDHNGNSGKARAQDAKRQRKSRLQRDKNVTREEKRREEKNKDKAVRATRLPADWALPAEWSDYCRQKRPDLDPEATALDFAEHYWAKAGKGSTSLNWKLVWQGWVRRQFAPRAKAKAAEDFFEGAY